MFRLVLPLLFASGIPWAALTWWRMRKARSERERRFIERTHSGMAVFFGLSLIALVALPGKLKLIVLPILVVTGLGIRHGMRRGLTRIQAADAADAFTRMKRVGQR